MPVSLQFRTMIARTINNKISSQQQWIIFLGGVEELSFLGLRAFVRLGEYGEHNGPSLPNIISPLVFGFGACKFHRLMLSNENLSAGKSSSQERLLSRT